jgi:glyoxylase-like metal-dependent hydrolase (beta-lactamase superfamily II)
VQRVEWEDAAAQLPELRGAYFERDFKPLQEAGLLDLLDRDSEIAPGISVRLTGAHTRGHQMVLLESRGRTALYPCDLCPTAAHLRPLWNMGYDQNMRETRRAKARWIGRAADENWLVLFAHDPQIRAAYLARDPKEEFIVREVVG